MKNLDMDDEEDLLAYAEYESQDAVKNEKPMGGKATGSANDRFKKNRAVVTAKKEPMGGKPSGSAKKNRGDERNYMAYADKLAGSGCASLIQQFGGGEMSEIDDDEDEDVNEAYTESDENQDSDSD